MKRFLVCFFIGSSALCTAICLHAQNHSPKSIKMIGRSSVKDVLLRWAPGDPIAWQYGNKYGYIVERYTMTHEKTLLQPPVQKICTPSPLLPAVKDKWLEVIDSNDYAAVAAQAIFGETFEIDLKKSNVVEIIQKVREDEQRYSLALFAADNSFAVAQLSALGFRDTTMQKNERYLYKVRINLPAGVEAVEPGLFFLNGEESTELVAPKDIKLRGGDKIVLLQWPVSNASTMYTAFIVERSVDNKEYKNVLKKPLIRIENQDMIYRDSLPDNHHDYYYRVRGITPFGEAGPPSQPLIVKGIDPFAVDLAIHKATIVGNEVTLQWKVDGDEILINNFTVLRSNKNEGPYKQVNAVPLSGNERTYLDKKPMATNYYKIVALNKEGRFKESYPYMVQMEDSIPPSSPQKIRATIDTSGVVRLTWIANNEPDLEGYRVYRSNFKNSEFSQITHHPVKTISYSDTISLKNLSNKIYYKIDAVDTRFNHSVFSEVIEVLKPDIVPPVPPVIKTVRSSEEGIYLSWINSSSADVAKHALYRRREKNKPWIAIKTFALSDTSQFYIDTPSDKGAYEYTLTAVDEHNLSSVYCPSVTGHLLMNNSPQIKNISFEVDRAAHIISLKWKYLIANIYKFQVFRGKENEPISLYKTLPGDSSGLRDVNLTLNTTYIYRVKALFRNGSESLFSEELKIKF